MPLLNNKRLANKPLDVSQLSRSLEKAFYMLEKLAKVWKPPVMSCNKYTLAIACLLDCVLKYIVSFCVSLEDITTRDAETLETVLVATEKNCQKLVEAFLVVDEIEEIESTFYDQVVPEFRRLTWVKKLIGMALLDIQSQYLSEDSELRNHISKEEVKSLIRALFQNTEIRAKVINSFK